MGYSKVYTIQGPGKMCHYALLTRRVGYEVGNKLWSLFLKDFGVDKFIMQCQSYQLITIYCHLFWNCSILEEWIPHKSPGSVFCRMLLRWFFFSPSFCLSVSFLSWQCDTIAKFGLLRFLKLDDHDLGCSFDIGHLYVKDFFPSLYNIGISLLHPKILLIVLQ